MVKTTERREGQSVDDFQSKKAFDSTDQTMKTEKTSAWSSFSGLVKGLLVKYGVVSESTYDTAVELGASAFDLSKTIKEGGLSGVALGTAEYIGGPLGVIAGEAIEILGQHLIDQTQNTVTIGERGVVFTAGQWVAIDAGVKAHDAVDDFMGTARGQPAFPEKLAKEGNIRAAHKIELGFYISEGEEQNTYKVFNFAHLREQDVYMLDIMPMSTAQNSAIGAIPFAVELRDARFQKFTPTTTGSKVNVDPGSQVVHSGKRYFVVKAVGEQVIIESEDGNRKYVWIKDLTRGVVKSTTSYHYTEDGSIAPGGFQSPGESAIFVGQWTWVPVRASTKRGHSELYCVSYIKGDEVGGFYALDGKAGSVDEEEVELVDDEFNAILEDIAAFRSFRSGAMYGYNMKLINPGKAYPQMCVGEGGTQAGKKVRSETLFGDDGRTSGYEQDMDGVGDGGLKEKVDFANERGDLITGMAAADEYADVYGPHEDAIESDSNGSNSLLPLLAIIGGAILIFNSVSV